MISAISRSFSFLKVKEYFLKMMQTALLFGADEETAQRDMRETLEFEMEMAAIQVCKNASRYTNTCYSVSLSVFSGSE